MSSDLLGQRLGARGMILTRVVQGVGEGVLQGSHVVLRRSLTEQIQAVAGRYLCGLGLGWLPRIENVEVQSFEVFGIAGDESEVVLKCCGGDESVRHRNLATPATLFSGQTAPAFRDGFGDRENAVLKPRAHHLIQPLLEFVAATTFG